ncbi:hypothetical protein [Bacillus sp. FJAT-45350]|uniref:hypothetical protein n=1 Tax=Bacillus sp. FJAT-45350 TaxID=2011014 RepID=UPI000BB9707F|nr:hypothetical protein [Bacillus sp. FJAT-45350]
MASKVLSAVLTLKDKNFSTGMRNASKGVSGFDKRLKYSGNQVKRFASNTTANFAKVVKSAAALAGAYLGIRAATSAVRESISLASELEELDGKFSVVFGNMSKEVEDWAGTQAQALGRSKMDLKGYLSENQNMLVGMGMAREEATKMSQDITTLGVDLASFNNLAEDDALRNLRSAISGNHGAAQSLGAVLNENTLSLEMNKRGLQGRFADLDESTKMELRYAAIVSQSSDALGDAERTSDSYANQQRRLAGIKKDLKAELGKGFLPIATKVTQTMANFASNMMVHMPKVQAFTERAMDGISRGMSFVGRMGTSTFRTVRGVIQDNQPTMDTMRSGLVFLGQTAIAIKDWFVDAFQNIKARISENRPTIDGVKSALEDTGVRALELKDWLLQAFDSAKPALNWLKDEGLPLVVDGVAGVIDKATGLYNYVNDNWSKFEPIVYGIAGSILFYKTAVGIAALATKGWAVATGILALAKAGLNTVLAISPLGWVALTIGAVIAVGVLLYKNWDTVKEKASELWSRLKERFEGIQNSVSESMDNAKQKVSEFFSPFIGFIDTVKSKWDDLKSSFSNFKMPKIGLPKWAGGNGLIQASYAVGTNRVPHDMVAQIHKDEMIIPARQSQRLREQGVTIDNITDMPQTRQQTTITRTENKTDRSTKRNNVIVNVYAKGTSAKEVLDELVPQLELVLDNM